MNYKDSSKLTHEMNLIHVIPKCGNESERLHFLSKASSWRQMSNRHFWSSLKYFTFKLHAMMLSSINFLKKSHGKLATNSHEIFKWFFNSLEIYWQIIFFVTNMSIIFFKISHKFVCGSKFQIGMRYLRELFITFLSIKKK